MVKFCTDDMAMLVHANKRNAPHKAGGAVSVRKVCQAVWRERSRAPVLEGAACASVAGSGSESNVEESPPSSLRAAPPSRSRPSQAAKATTPTKAETPSAATRQSYR